MFRRYVVIPVALTIVSLFLAAQPARADFHMSFGVGLNFAFTYIKSPYHHHHRAPAVYYHHANYYYHPHHYYYSPPPVHYHHSPYYGH